MIFRTLCLLALLQSGFTLVAAQFNFFDQVFQQQQAQQRASGASGWAAQADAVPCSQYLCPDTLNCVEAPADCPCPHVQDIKCLVPDLVESGSATVVCVTGDEGCARIEKLASKGSW
ncbi:hypothetical protein SISNIDRAFT_449478 [Sistotremastrum niveocremeum HHB9708]|uniref:Long chronological lifespan protein 2 n=2 Tax=Sistotremastraceae TaxID=3402574 RepID=A0A164ZNF1_9AGAM|nr:hypothetical protein SISNIDRAFT_449478 [Sistotremastrum niveocremeum HHB9708]KZT43010.1 hypothetical protein SISSUDRAFT_1040900 [Sistotremastrum suecicum HHB10207 ss-3]